MVRCPASKSSCRRCALRILWRRLTRWYRTNFSQRRGALQPIAMLGIRFTRVPRSLTRDLSVDKARALDIAITAIFREILREDGDSVTFGGYLPNPPPE